MIRTKSVLGWMDHERVQYLCPECPKGRYPSDQELVIPWGNDRGSPESHDQEKPKARPYTATDTHYISKGERVNHGRFREEGYPIDTERLKRAGAHWKKAGTQDTTKAGVVWLRRQRERLQLRNSRGARAA